ncbi:unnamed protein product [Rhodiola kirilowii]
MKELTGSVHQLGTSLHQFQAKTDGAITDLTKQISQLTTSMSALTNEPGQLPSQTIQNPKENVSAVTLRSGRKLDVQPMETEEEEEPRLPREEQMRPKALDTPMQDASEEEKDAAEEERNAPEEHRLRPVPRTETSKISASLPFPVPARVPKQHVMDEDVFELFRKVEINIPLLEAIKQIPRYAKFLKELCTNRRKGTRNDQELMSRNISAVIQRKVPPKSGDPGTYTIPCTIGNIRLRTACWTSGLRSTSFHFHSIRASGLDHSNPPVSLSSWRTDLANSLRAK